MTTRARMEAEAALGQLSWSASFRGLGWAILDLAEAVREGHETTYQILYPEEPE